MVRQSLDRAKPTLGHHAGAPCLEQQPEEQVLKP